MHDFINKCDTKQSITDAKDSCFFQSAILHLPFMNLTQPQVSYFFEWKPDG